MQSQVMQDLAAKKAELEARLLQLKQEQEAAQKEFELMQSGGEKAQEALAVLEQLLNETPNEMKPALFKSLYKALEQEAKRAGISLLAEATVSVNGNGKASTAESNGKRTRKSKDELTEPANFSVFPNNNRLAVNGFIQGNAVKFNQVYISVDGLRATPASEASATVWKAWFLENQYATSIKTGDMFDKAKDLMAGIYLLELSDVTLKDLSKLVDLDFSKAPDSEENERRMNQDYVGLILLTDEEEPASEPEIQPTEEPTPVQHEEIMEVAPANDFLPIGTKFQATGLQGFESKYGEVVGVNPSNQRPYECKLDGFAQNIMLSDDQFTAISEEEYETEEEDLNIPF
jgi:hypothetical protein